MKVKVLKKILSGHGHHGKKGDILDVPDELAKIWVQAKYVEQVKKP